LARAVLEKLSLKKFALGSIAKSLAFNACEKALFMLKPSWQREFLSKKG
jgi:hypothetical protein